MVCCLGRLGFLEHLPLVGDWGEIADAGMAAGGIVPPLDVAEDRHSGAPMPSERNYPPRVLRSKSNDGRDPKFSSFNSVRASGALNRIPTKNGQTVDNQRQALTEAIGHRPDGSSPTNFLMKASAAPKAATGGRSSIGF